MSLLLLLFEPSVPSQQYQNYFKYFTLNSYEVLLRITINLSFKRM